MGLRVTRRERTAHRGTSAAAPTTATPATAGDAPRHARPRPRRRTQAGRVVALVLTGALTTTASAATTIALRMQSNVTRVDPSALLEANGILPPAPVDPTDPHGGQPVNILLIGSDDRSGANADLGGKADGMRSDTALLMHISADRSRVELVSLPRDAIVALPACTVTGGGTTSASKGAMFNEAFARGWLAGHDLVSAAACTMTAVQTLTGVPLNGFVSVDFAGFTAMVDAIGGVPMCIPRPLHDDEAGLDLAAGTQTLDGRQSLALARARHDLSDGSDTYRLGRQQALLAAMARTVVEKNVMRQAPQLLTFLDAVTRSLTMSTDLSPTGIAYSLRSISPASITFLTTPSAPMPSDHDRVVWSDAAAPMWANMAADRPLDTPVGTTPPPPTAGPTASPTAAATGAPAGEPAPAPTTERPAVDTLADRRPGVAISSADAQAACAT